MKPRTRKGRGRRPSRLPPKIEKLIAADSAPLSVPAARRLTTREIASLKDLLTGKIRPEPAAGEIRLSKAVEALAQAEPSPAVAAVLAKVVADPRHAAVDRAVAAVGLRLMPSAEARAGAIAALNADDPMVRVNAIKALGCVGDDGALGPLEAMTPASEPERRHLVFARALIAHRAGRRVPSLPFEPKLGPPSRRPGMGAALALHRLRPATIRAHREKFRGSDYGVRPSDDVALEITCGESRWTLFVHEDVVKAGDFAPLAARPWVAGIMAAWIESTHSYAPQYVLLTSPTGDQDDDGAGAGAGVQFVRTDGQVIYVGRLVREPVTTAAAALRFAVRDFAGTPSAPPNVDGRLTARTVEVNVHAPMGVRRQKAHGEPAIPLAPPLGSA